MVRRKIYYINASFQEVLKGLLLLDEDQKDFLLKRYHLYIPGGIRVGIVALTNGTTRITISHRKDRNNEERFFSTISLIEKRLVCFPWEDVSYGEIKPI